MHDRVLAVLGAVLATNSVALAGGMVWLPPGGSIQAAIDAASDGDEIQVPPGVYFEAISFNGKRISLVSTDGPSETIIDASGSGSFSPVVFLGSAEPAGSLIDGFTLRGGSGYGAGSNKSGGGVFLQNTDAVVRNCVITANTADFGAGIAVYGGSPLIENCLVRENVALGCSTSGTGGTAFHATNSTARVVNSTFDQNSAAGYQRGAIYCRSAGPEFVSCRVTRNTATSGTGMYISASAARLSNCTFAGNEATTGTGGVYLSGSLTIDVVNSILWGNDGPTSAQIVKSTSTPLNISHCFVEGGWISGVPEEVYDLDPQFIDSASGDYRLASGSPALDFGMNEGNAPMPSTDLDGLPRIVNDVVDLGAYEFQGEAPSACPGDLDGNGTVEFADLLDQLQSWGSCSGCAADLNQDGLVDFDDVLALLQLWGSCP